MKTEGASHSCQLTLQLVDMKLLSRSAAYKPALPTFIPKENVEAGEQTQKLFFQVPVASILRAPNSCTFEISVYDLTCVQRVIM